MKFYFTIFSLFVIAFLSGCSGKQEQLIVPQTISNFHVDENATMIDEKIQDESPFKVQTFKVKFKDSENISWAHTQDSMKVILSDMSENGKIIQVAGSIKGGLRENYHKKELIVPTLELLVQELHKRGYKYFQIIKPTSLSNFNGFPINTVADLATYLAPELNNPSDDNELENATDNHSSISTSITVFFDNTLEFTIIIIDKPKPYQIVWNVENNL
jgi:hypothetical protein